MAGPNQEERLIESQIEIGKRILAVQGTLKLGTKPGFLDRMLGEEDVRRNSINDQEVDEESAEYQNSCRNAYHNFRKEYPDSALREAAFTKINNRYHAISKEAEERDEVSYSKVLTDSLLLSSFAVDKSKNLAQGSQSEITEPSISQTLPNEYQTHNTALPNSENANTLTSYAASTLKMVSNSASWVNENIPGSGYGMLMFAASHVPGSSASRIAKSTAVAGALASSLPTSEAVMVGDKDYKTTVFCGPEISCKHLRNSAQSKKVNLIEFDEGGKTDKNRKVERLLIIAHGNSAAKMTINKDTLSLPDVFARVFFPKVTIIHAFGCKIGSNPQKNFAENSLNPGQALFLYAGNESVYISDPVRLSEYLLLKPNSQFPSPSPLNILLKETKPKSGKPSTIFAELTPLPLQDIISVINNDSNIDEIFNLVVKNINDQKQKALDKFSGNDGSQRALSSSKTPENTEAVKLITAELEKLGFRSFDKEMNQDDKREFVTDYLEKYISTIFEHSSISPEKIENIDTLFKSGLIDVNRQFEYRSTLAYQASISDKSTLLEVLGKYGADFNKYSNGKTPTYSAAQNNNHESLEVLGKYRADFNKNSKDGITPAFVAATKHRHESLKVLKKYRADFNIAGDESKKTCQNYGL